MRSSEDCKRAATKLDGLFFRVVKKAILAGTLAAVAACGAGATEQRKIAVHSALADYVYRQSDQVKESRDHFSWKVKSYSKPSGDIWVLRAELTSQLWNPLDLIENQPVWHHRLTVYIPASLRHNTAILYINGGTVHGSDRTAQSEPSGLDFFALSRKTGRVVVDLKDVPNQSLTFKGEPPRKEDDLMARAWISHMDAAGGCPECLLQFPMVKAVVRAMDAVQAIFAKRSAEQAPKQFVLVGASKRGWAAWLAATVDARVAAIMPMVSDGLNMKACIAHCKAVYGRLPESFRPYGSRGQDLLARLHSKAFEQSLEDVDPWRNRPVLTLPKYVITAAADQFYPPDTTRFYWSDLKGAKALRTYPNSGHRIIGTPGDAERVIDTIASFVGRLADKGNLPTLDSSELTASGGSVTLSERPRRVRIWSVNNPSARDFRLETLQQHDLHYQSRSLPLRCSRIPCRVSLSVEQPKSGWTAWFAEFTLANGDAPDFVVTTPVQVTPERYPDNEARASRKAKVAPPPSPRPSPLSPS